MILVVGLVTLAAGAVLIGHPIMAVAILAGGAGTYAVLRWQGRGL